QFLDIVGLRSGDRAIAGRTLRARSADPFTSGAQDLSTTLGPPSDRPVERSGEADCGCPIRAAGARKSSSKASGRYPGAPASLDRESQPGQQAQLGLPKLQPVAAPTSPL